MANDYVVTVDGTDVDGKPVTIDESFTAIDDMKAMELGGSKVGLIVDRSKVIMGRYSIKTPKKGIFGRERLIITTSISNPYRPQAPSATGSTEHDPRFLR
jgi:hypothetical protein